MFLVEISNIYFIRSSMLSKEGKLADKEIEKIKDLFTIYDKSDINEIPTYQLIGYFRGIYPIKQSSTLEWTINGYHRSSSKKVSNWNSPQVTMSTAKICKTSWQFSQF